MENAVFIERLAEILLKNHVITREEARVYREQFAGVDHDNFDEFLLDEGLVNKDDLLQALGEYYNVPFVDVVGYFFDHELLSNFPKDFLLRNEIIPLELDGDILIVAAADPDDSTLAPKIEKFVSTTVEFQVSLARDIADAVKEFYDKSVTEVSEDIALDEERKERDEFEREGKIEEDES